MPATHPAAAVFGPFDGDFDPFDDDDEIGVLITFGRGRASRAAASPLTGSIPAGAG